MKYQTKIIYIRKKLWVYFNKTFCWWRRRLNFLFK